MFLKSLTISLGDGTIIRNIQFHLGLNLIVDETPLIDDKKTGNNVGKTTVLKLIDFCLGGDKKGIYSDAENKKNEYKAVKEFLANEKICVSLILTDSLLEEGAREVIIERNFLTRKNKIQRIDGEEKTDELFNKALTDLLFPAHYGNKPTFRQLIAHNIRYKELSTTNTLKHLDGYTRDDEYETLYLFLLGCNFDRGDIKQELRTKIESEEKFKKRLESEQTRSGYETALALLEEEIKEFEDRKSSLNLNPNFESDLDTLNDINYKINVISSEITRIELRKNLILEAQREMQSKIAKIDLQQLQQIYQQATDLTGGIQKTFDDLYNFHNQMVEAKIKFIVQDLPKLDVEIDQYRKTLNQLLAEEDRLSQAITKSDSYEILEQVISELNDRHRKKGEYENALRQLRDVESKLASYHNELSEIDNELFSENFFNTIQLQMNKFNRHFSAVSNELYGEKYALKVDRKTTRNGEIYEFSSFNINFSSGKKQGEISCFDIAYTLFADEEGIPCMHFLLYDKKELMHDNQLVKIARLVNTKQIQFVASILKDKLPEELNQGNYEVLRLSQDDKLFKIEKFSHS